MISRQFKEKARKSVRNDHPKEGKNNTEVGLATTAVLIINYIRLQSINFKEKN